MAAPGQRAVPVHPTGHTAPRALFFAQPPGRTIGNGGGGTWGEIRGLNGVIIAAPTVHPEGGEYRWERTGAVPVLPEALAALLPDASPAVDTATDAQVRAFIAGHQDASRPELLDGWRKVLADRFATGSRHKAAVSVTVGALKESAAGLLDATTVLDTLGPMFVAAATRRPTGGEKQRTEASARAEYASIVAWAVGQALAADPAETRARTEDKMPGDFWGTSASPAVGRLEQVAADDEAPDRPAAPSLASRLLTRSALRSLADPEPLIGNVIDQGTCALLYGHRGTYKSFIALDWALSVATGRPWQGRPTERRRVLYVAAEGAFGFKGRTDAWEIGRQRQVSDDEFLILPAPVNLTDPREVAELGALIVWGGYGLVVLDTMARCTVGADENSAKDIGRVVDQMYRLLDRTPDRRGMVLGVHHTGKDGQKLRGSSAYEAGMDTIYSVKREDKGGPVTLDREKRKDGPEADRHTLKLALIEGTNSGVMEASQQGGTTAEDSTRAGTVLSLFVSLFPTTGASVSDLKSVCLESGMSKTTFYRAVRDLVNSGDLINTGTVKRPFYKVGSK